MADPVTTYDGRVVSIGDLKFYDTKAKAWVSDELEKFDVVKKDTATAGYAATYEVQFDGTKIGTEINIPKDFMLKDASIETCQTENVPVQGYQPGDKYFDFEVNVVDSSETSKHIYLLVSDAFAAYVAGDGITIDNQTISTKTGDGLGINSTSQAVEVKTGDGIEIDATTKGVKAKIGDGLQTNDTTKATEVKTGDGIQINSTSKAIEAKPGTGLEINSTSKAIDLIAQSSNAGAPAVGGVTTSDYAAFKGAADTFSATAGNATAGTAVGNVTPYTKTVTVASTDVGGTATADAFHFDVEWKEYGNATPTSGQTAAAAGLMSGTDKDKLDGLNIATENELKAAFGWT